MSTKKQYLYKIVPTRLEMLSEGATPEEDRITGEHFDYLKNLVEQGVVILAGRTQTTTPDSFGIIIFQAESDAAAQEIVDHDPAVRQGVMQATLYPYRIALQAFATIDQM